MGILLAVFLIILNPNQQFVKTNNTARRTDVIMLLDSVRQYATDHKGKFPANMPAKGAAAELIEGTGGADICADISPIYIAQLPTDPLNVPAVSDCTIKTYNTGYTIAVDASGRVTIAAPSAEAVGGVTPVISVTR